MYAQLSDAAVFQPLLEELSTIINDQDRLSTSQKELDKRSKCYLSFYDGKPTNILVFPVSAEEVSNVVKIAAKHRVPVVPYGGGTSLEGGFSAPFGGICIDFKHMSKVVEVRPADLDVTVQPGVVWTDLNTQLAEHGLFFPLDPGYGATIGGMIATSCSGTNAARYGTMKDGWILGLVVVLADGSIVRTKGRVKKTSSGYDMTRLMIGSEGTLGIVTEATLKLANIPKCSTVATCAFDSAREIVGVASQILRRGIDFQCIEYLDEFYMASFNDYQERTNPEAIKFLNKPHLFVKICSNSEQGLREDGAILKQLCAGGSDFRLADTPEEADALWNVRKQISLIFGTSNRKETDPSALSTDVCVPLSELGAIVEFHRQDLNSRPGLRSAILGHVGDGNIHSLILFDRSVAQDVQAAEDVHKALIKKALAVGGTITGEHGVGTAKAEFLEAEHGARLVQAMKDVKKSLDPDGIFNPGQLFPRPQLL